jgi:hypothetical protein
MKIFLMIALAASAFAGCNSQTSSNSAEVTDTSNNTSPSSAPAEDTGWVSLFDGQTLNGWHSFGKTTAGSAWSADSGTIHLNSATKKTDSAAGGDLVTDDSYQNFDLKLEWKISKAGNSGILFYVQDDKPTYQDSYKTGPEMQVLDDERHDDRKTPSHRAGSLYDMIQATPGAVKPAGEWNTAEIVSNNGKLDFYLNGVHVVNTTIFDDNWKQMLAKSKFKEWPQFGTFTTGHIALQDHGNDVWYRNIMIKKL